tara:strand:+ start:16 stop:168 length:153 start_codon:yes stop_codon:yes gene_type:complete
MSVSHNEIILENTYNQIVDELVDNGMPLEKALVEATTLTMEKWKSGELGE